MAAHARFQLTPPRPRLLSWTPETFLATDRVAMNAARAKHLEFDPTTPKRYAIMETYTEVVQAPVQQGLEALVVDYLAASYI